MGASADDEGGDPESPSVLLHATDAETVASVTRGLNEAGFRVTVAESASATLGQLGTRPFDCLVVSSAAEGLDTADFVTALPATPNRCPVVWLVDGDLDPVMDEALDVPTTVVERGSLDDDAVFLARKVRGVIRTDSPRGADRSTFETLVESASDGLYTLDAAGRVTYLNESFASMLGYDRSELVGTHAAMVMADGELERGQALIEELLAADERESDAIDMEMVRQGGSHITVSVHFSVLTAPDGTYEGVMGVVRDITERKRRERELVQRRDRMEEFAAAVSHDLRAPLSVAMGNLEMLDDEVDSEQLDTAIDALDRMEHLVEDLLELARKGRTVSDPIPVSLGEVVDDARASLPDRTTVHDDLESATVHGDRVRLVELLENLFQNAVDHVGPAVTIHVGPLESGDGFFVADDGSGIPPDRRQAVFEHGHTTSREGTGFGLTIVRRIVEAHGWEIEVTESAAGGARLDVHGVDSFDPGDA